MPTLRVSLNGTAENPYNKFGLTQNPFPQIARYETDQQVLRLASLGGDPIPHDSAERYIRQRLSGFTAELVDLCVSKFAPGKYVEFSVSWREK